MKESHYRSGQHHAKARKSHSLFKKSALATAISFCSLSASYQSFAQEPTFEEEAVIVLGIRKSLEESLDVKRDADQLVDVITAEDAGKLPDDNVARALQRVTGVQITNREGLGSEVQVRGLSQVNVLLNGASFVGTPSQQSPRDSVKRNIVLEDLPSEVFTSMQVIKTPEANDIEGAIGATVNLKTRKPLDLNGLTMSANWQNANTKYAESNDPRLSFFIGNNFDDKFGAYLNVSKTKSTVRSDRMDWINWQNVDLDLDDVSSAQTYTTNILDKDQSNLSQALCNPYCVWNKGADENENRDYILMQYNGRQLAEVYAPGQIELIQNEIERDRLGLILSGQYRAAENLEFYADVMHTKFEEDREAQTIRLSTSGEYYNEVVFDPTIIVDNNGIAQDFETSDDFLTIGSGDNAVTTTTLTRAGWQANPEPDGPDSNGSYGGFPHRQGGTYNGRDATTTNVRLGFSWYNDDWTVAGNINSGKSEFDSIFMQQDLRAGTGKTTAAWGNRPVDPRTGIAPEPVPQTRWWYDLNGGGNLGTVSSTASFTDPNNVIYAFSSIWNDKFETNEDAIMLDVDYEFGSGFFSELEFGVRYSDRSNSRRVTRGIGTHFRPECNNVEGVTTGVACDDAGGLELTDRRLGVDPFRELHQFNGAFQPSTAGILDTLTVNNNDSFMGGVDGVIPRVWLSSSPREFNSLVSGADYRKATSSGPVPISKAEFEACTEEDTCYDANEFWRMTLEADPINDLDITETTSAGYFQINFGNNWLDGNFGVRYIKTEITAASNDVADDRQQIYLFSRIYRNTTTSHLNSEGVSDYILKESTTSYSNSLPSLNLNFHVTNDLDVRFSASKTMSRPDPTDITPGNFPRSLVEGTVIRGNPDLKPYLATQFDLAAEWYYDDGALLSATLFNKRLDNFSTTEITQEEIPELGNGTFTVFKQVNGEGKVNGIELSAQQPFTFLPEPFDGLGAVVNFTIADSSTPEGTPVPQLSENSFNIITYYEKAGFSARFAYNWRDDRLVNARGFGGQKEYIEDFGQLDMSLSYDFSENFTLTFDAMNLTQEDEKRYVEDKERKLSYRQFDRTFLIGFRARI